jgi:hypothetical protein
MLDNASIKLLLTEEIEAEPHKIKVCFEKSRVKSIMIDNGYREKVQENNELDLNPYVYEAAKTLMVETIAKALNVDINNVVVELT